MSTRRSFLEAATSVALAPNAAFAANDQVQIATIGAGGMGSADTRMALCAPGVKLTAPCPIPTGGRLRC